MMSTLVQLLPLTALPPGFGDKLLTYAAPPWMAPLLQVGSLVRMPFAHQADIPGLVLALNPPDEWSGAIKSIDSVAYHGAPVCSPNQLALWRWMAHYYGASLAEVAQVSLPGVVLNPRHFQSEPGMGPSAPIGARSRLTQVRKPEDPSALAELPKRLKAIHQQLITWQTEGALPLLETEALAQLKTNKASLARLAHLNLITLDHSAQPCHSIPGAPPGLVPTAAQRMAIEAVNGQGATPHPWLLHGVTGSGKTEVYLRLAQAAWERGEGVLVLVPEIALTGPIAARFYERFGTEAMALWHSQIAEGDRLNTWFRLLRGECKVLVGARSAILAPLQDIGLIIIDEAHDDSFKQDAPAPRYDTRTVSRWLADQHEARLLIGSATPTVGQFWEARQHPESLLSLPDRAMGQALPTVNLVDMRQERTQGRGAEVLALRFRQALLATVEQEQQVIVLLNRRGYNTLLNCGSCGEVFHCPDCSVAVTYHQVAHEVRCHYCGWTGEVPTFCPQCASLQVQRMGTGTQRLTEELVDLLAPINATRAAQDRPPVELFRLDSDVMARKGASAEVLAAFRSAPAGAVLVGTQMVAKGLDIPGVTLVGVVNADSSFYLPEYKSHERGFQLLTQVAGRAGRGEKLGTVYLQTSQPDHAVLDFAKRQDFIGFYEWEISQRLEHGFPPFSGLIRVVVSDEEEARAQQYANALTNVMRQHVGQVLPPELAGQVSFLGPSASMVAKVQGRFRFHVLIKLAGAEEADRTVAREAIVAFYRDLKPPKGLRVLLDVDAQSLL
jgi:primosomal protein N' (replication factor Y) (superfamily II helicase)